MPYDKIHRQISPACTRCQYGNIIALHDNADEAHCMLNAHFRSLQGPSTIGYAIFWVLRGSVAHESSGGNYF